MSERSAEKARNTCGHCGVYRDLHPTALCERSRYSFWWDRHYLHLHIAAWLWLRLNDRQRMDIVHRIWSRRPDELCWCEFVDSALLDDKRGDWDCGCDVPLPTRVSTPRWGFCYCTPPTQVADRG